MINRVVAITIKDKNTTIYYSGLVPLFYDFKDLDKKKIVYYLSRKKQRYESEMYIIERFNVKHKSNYNDND